MMAQNKEYREMVAYAVKAPSGHNTQPWKFRLQANSIEIIPDLSKELPVVDADHRELFISLGCATENLCLAATSFGYETETSIASDGVITVHLKKAVGVPVDSLFTQIAKRQTNRNVYDYKTIAEDTLNACLQVIPVQDNIRIYSWKNGDTEFGRLKRWIELGNALQMEDANFKNELKEWMRYNKKHSEAKEDGMSYSVFGAPNLPQFISKPVMSSFLNGKQQNKGDMKKIESSSHLLLFTSKGNQISDWITLGRYLQRFLLKTTEQHIAAAYMNQPCEVGTLRTELKEALLPADETPQLILRIGYGNPAPYSKRRPVEDVIIE